jgi:hypothetical protein
VPARAGVDGSRRLQPGLESRRPAARAGVHRFGRLPPGLRSPVAARGIGHIVHVCAHPGAGTRARTTPTSFQETNRARSAADAPAVAPIHPPARPRHRRRGRRRARAREAARPLLSDLGARPAQPSSRDSCGSGYSVG